MRKPRHLSVDVGCHARGRVLKVRLGAARNRRAWVLGWELGKKALGQRGCLSYMPRHVSASVLLHRVEGKCDAPVNCCCLLWDERLKLCGLVLCSLHLKGIILLLLDCLGLLTRIVRLQHRLILGLLCVRVECCELRLHRGRVVHRRHRRKLRRDRGELRLELPRLRFVDRKIDEVSKYN